MEKIKEIVGEDCARVFKSDDCAIPPATPAEIWLEIHPTPKEINIIPNLAQNRDRFFGCCKGGAAGWRGGGFWMGILFFTEKRWRRNGWFDNKFIKMMKKVNEMGGIPPSLRTPQAKP